MLDRLSVNALLKSVITILVVCVVTLSAVAAWTSWRRVVVADRIDAVLDTSMHMFTALHHLRLDRSSSVRELRADRQFTELTQETREAREAIMPALRAAIRTLDGCAFPERAAAVSRLSEMTEKLAKLQSETAAAFLQPKAQRRPRIAEDYFDAANAMLALLDDLSGQLARLVKLDDPYVDQLLALKQLAWQARNIAGELSVMISTPMGGQPVKPNAMAVYDATVGRLDGTWQALGYTSAGLTLPAKLIETMRQTDRDLFVPDYVALRARVMRAIVEGKPTGFTVPEWTKSAIPRFSLPGTVAHIALETAKAHASQQRTSAQWALGWQLGMLAAALVAAFAMMVVISRRVTSPLVAIQSAMLKLAGGDMSAEASFPGRSDEIGKLASAMNTFKHGMIEADRMRSEQKEAEVAAAKEREAAQLRASEERKVTREREAAAQKELRQKLADDFYSAIGRIIDHVSAAAGELEKSATTLTKTAETTLDLTGVVASASEEASSNVGAVASAAEELTGSVNEIARQVQESSRIAGEAVTQAKATDVRIGELSQAAGRIGDVLKLITAIAEQTNLLALNATIEAARAGEAGKGFAVVAQEVKALAAQTAKATEEIASQISDMQMATADSVGAIKTIGTTISRISEIAAAIAAAVEEQGAATGEIARNVTEASRGTAQVANTIGDVNRGATATGSASTQVLTAARTLAGESKDLKSEVEKFLDTVRAA
jgi:methyl-accepting chemotaxis protein